MKYNIRKEKVFELLGREENQSLSVKELLDKLNAEGIKVTQPSFYRYKKEFTQLQSSEETELETLISNRLETLISNRLETLISNRLETLIKKDFGRIFIKELKIIEKWN